MTFKPSYDGYLTIIVEKATEVLAMDLNGKSDPYAYFAFVSAPEPRLAPKSGCIPRFSSLSTTSF